jgi:hypothetical protein
MMDALRPLRLLTEGGMGVLLLHHPTKAKSHEGNAARGSGALSAFADIVLELRKPGGNPATRHRRLLGFSRFEETPRQIVAELNPDGADYQSITIAPKTSATIWSPTGRRSWPC